MTHIKIGKEDFRQLIRYGMLGLPVNIIGYIVYLLITFIGGTPKVTMTCLYFIGVWLSFFGNQKYTFEHSGSLLKSGVRYFMAHCLGYMINLTILLIMVDWLGYKHQWIQAVAIVVVAVYLFLTFKFYVFKKNSSKERNFT